MRSLHVYFNVLGVLAYLQVCVYKGAYFHVCFGAFWVQLCDFSHVFVSVCAFLYVFARA